MADPLNQQTKAAELAKQTTDYFEKQGEIIDDLSEKIKKMTAEHENTFKVLKKISFEKQLQEEIQQRINTYAHHIQLLETNIGRRHERLKNIKKEISDIDVNRLKYGKTLSRLDHERLSNLIKVKDFSKEYIDSLRGAVGLLDATKQKIIDSLKHVRGFSKASTDPKSLEKMIQTAEIVKRKYNLIGEQATHIRNKDKERKLLLQIHQKYSKQIMESWKLSIPIVGKLHVLLGNINTVLRAIGLKTANISFLTSGWFLGASSVLSLVLIKAVDLFKDLDTAAFEFRKQWGFSRDVSKEMETRIRDIVVETSHLGIYFKDAFEALTFLGREIGSVRNVTDEMVKNVSIFNKQFGITSDVSAKFLKTISSIAGSTIESQKGLYWFTKHLTDATKVPLGEVMSDVAKASESAYSYINKSPLLLIKAAVEARRFGTSLSSLVSSSKSLLNFTESIQNEMEFAVLAGRNINFQKARQLAYDKDIRGLNKEILRLAKEVNFNQLDPFQAAAFARALGMTESEIAKILQTEKERNILMVHAQELAKKGDDRLLKELQHEQDLLNMNKKEAEITGEILAERRKHEQNQTRLAAIWDSINKTLSEMAVILLPLIDVALKGVLKVLNAWGPSLGLIIGSFGNILSKADNVFKYLSTGLLTLTKKIKSISSVINYVVSKFITPWVKFLPILGKVGAVIGKWMGPIGWAVAGIQLIFTSIKNIKEAWESTNGVLNVTWGIIKALAISVYDVLLKPFVDIIKWISDWFAPGSPSKIGMLIIDGFKSTAIVLYDTLLMPFDKIISFVKTTFKDSVIGSVKDIISSVTGFFDKTFSNIKGWFTKSKPTDFQSNIQRSLENIPTNDISTDALIKPKVDLSRLPNSLTSISLDKNARRPETTTILPQATKSDIQSLYNEPTIIKEGGENERITSYNRLILAIENLHKDLLEGKISVNLDGQLVSTTMNRGNKFRGNFGAISG